MPRRSQGVRLTRRPGRPFWEIAVPGPGGRTSYHSTGTADRAAAEAGLADFRLRTQAAVKPLRSPDQYPIHEALATYLTSRAATAASAQQAAIAVQHLLAHFGDATIDMITPETVQGYIDARRAAPGARGRPISYATIGRELAVLRVAINDAAKAGRLTRAPFVRSPPAVPARDLWLEHWEVDLLLRASRGQPHLALWLLLAISTAGRKLAILDLTWPQVDFLRRRISLNPPGRAQTTKGRATVPMSDDIEAALRAAQERATIAHVVEYRPPGKAKGRRVLNIRKALGSACRRASRIAYRLARRADYLGDMEQRRQWLAAFWKLRRTTPHTLRHTSGTWMAQSGVALEKIGAFLGHSNWRTTQKYAHHSPDYLGDAADAIQRRGGFSTLSRYPRETAAGRGRKRPKSGGNAGQK